MPTFLHEVRLLTKKISIKMVLQLDCTLQKPCERSPCLVLALEIHDSTKKSINVVANDK